MVASALPWNDNNTNNNNNNNQHPKQHNQRWGGSKKKTKLQPRSKHVRIFEGDYYCWSHVCNKGHNSKDCKTQLSSHQLNATLGNSMGGNPKNSKHTTNPSTVGMTGRTPYEFKPRASPATTQFGGAAQGTPATTTFGSTQIQHQQQQPTQKQQMH